MLGDRPSSGLGLFGMALGLILANSGCTGHQFRGPTSESFLRTIQESKDPNARYVAYDSLSSPRAYDDEAQRTKAAQVLVAKLKEGREPVATRAVICRTLGNLKRPEARDVILTATNDEDPLVRAEACRSLGRVGRREDATILAKVMAADNSAECRVAAIESLGDLKAPDKRINEFLVSGMEHDEPVIRVASMKALKSITGKDLGIDAMAWKKYVESMPNTTPSTAIVPMPAAAAATLPVDGLPPEIR